MKVIELTQGKQTLVDDGVYEWASKFKWHAIKARKTFYAVRKSSHRLGKRYRIWLHREILQPEAHLDADHRDGNGLNNLRENLRAATNQQNQQAYKAPRKNKTSKFRGVSLNARNQVWTAYIRLSGVAKYLGSFEFEEAAARAYDTAARKFFGEFAQPNFPSA